MSPASAPPAPAAAAPPVPGFIPPAGRRAPVDSRQSASSLIDEAAHRLRLAPIGTLGIYYAGSLPFVLALLYFWADMSHRADAAERGAGSAFIVGALFLIMKSAHAVFAARLRAQFAREPMPRWTAARLGRVLLVQTGLHAPGLFILQAAAALLFPVGWVYAFYQNVTALGDGTPGVTTREIARRAWRHALARPGPNHTALSILGGLACFVWFNLLVAAFFLPQLVQMFTGEENAFTRDMSSLFNTTLFAVSGALVYLAVDPLAKTFYALRCFYADSARTGEDLLAELRALPPVATLTTSPAAGPRILARVGLLLLLCGTAALPLAAAPLPSVAASPVPVVNPAPAPPAAPVVEGPRTVSPPALDRSIRDVLSRREFAWRAPRPAKPAAAGQKDHWLEDEIKRVSQWMRDLRATLRRWFHRDEPATPPPVPSSEAGPAPLLQPIIYVVVGLLAVAMGYLLWDVWRGRRGTRRLDARPLDPVAGKVLPSDLAAEDLLATQLPEDEWLALARRLLESGERRLALRAMYLSLLAGLGDRGLLVVARHKSNRDYLQELRRRARDRPGVPGAFGRSVGAFERVWYGSHPVDDGLLGAFEADRAQALG